MTRARTAGSRLDEVIFDAAYSSPLKRSYDTARMAGGGMKVQKDDHLIEIDFGAWEGKTKKEFIPENEALWARWNETPETTRAGGTGETAMEVVTRVDGFYRKILKDHASGNVLVVGHNGINRLYLACKLVMQLRNYRRFLLDNAAVSWFTLDKPGW